MKTLTANNLAKLTERLSQTPNDAKRTPDEVMRVFHEVDPTDKKAFVMPLFRWYIDGSMRYIEDAHKARDGLAAYGRFRNRNLQPLRSLTFSQFLDLADELADEKSQSELSREETDAFFKNGSAELFYDDDRVRIVIPRTREASCYFGRGTRWCTASDKNNYFDHYNDQGPLHIIMWKGKPHKWQMHVESETILDERDEQILSDHVDDLKYLFNEILIPNEIALNDQYILKLIKFTGTCKNSIVEFHCQDGKYHRDNDQPAIINVNGDQFWYRDGQRHRDNDQPAIICVNGNQYWYRDGRCHRDNDQPSAIYANGDQHWCQDGKLHRDNDLPATIYANGERRWYRDGVQIT